MELYIEEWKNVKGFEGLYQISNYGRVKSLKYNKSSKIKIMKVHQDKDGYIQVKLSKEAKQYTFKVHRLVATHFLENPDLKSEVNHINEIKDDNKVTNLQWVTPKENSNHGTRNRKISKRQKEAWKRKLGDF